MELLAAALAESLKNRWALCVFGAIGGRQILDAVGHVLVDVGNLRSGVAWIDKVGAIKNERR